MRMLVEPNRNDIEDLPRNSQDVALIGDPRNDENTIVGQLQLLFLRLHNKIGEQVANEGVPEGERFVETQQRVRWHYQWVVTHDYLPRVIGGYLFGTLYKTDPKGNPEITRPHYEPRTNAYMPVEFSAAAFRFGHSQVRGVYDLNTEVTQRPIFSTGPLTDPTADLRGFRRLPGGWTIEWPRFFEIDGSTPQPSRRIDATLVPHLFDLPDGGGSLALRNLLRGQALGLPSGQDVAKFLRVERVLTGADLGAPEPTPLWFYILKESDIVTGGEFLGPVGGRIVGEVLLGLLELDPKSWFSLNPRWRPKVADGDEDAPFTMADLIKLVTG